MRTVCLALALAALSLSSHAATNVGISIGIDQPGMYGRIDIGRVAAPPVLVYAQPVVIVPTPVVQYQSPIYLHVPPGHAKDWRRHCGHYGACNRPVYFVNEGWYRDHYRDRYHARQEHHDHRHHKGEGKGKKKGKSERD